MVSPRTIEKLLWHAGLPSSDDDRVGALTSRELPSSADQVTAALADCMATMATLNHELNGPVPSETAGMDARDEYIPRSVAYSVVEIVDYVRYAAAHVSDAALRAELERAGRYVEIAWNMILAGDMDDIVRDVELEDRMREA